ncbi:aspartyl-tRNA(Asn)/glutamyl-tRNA (Gln) amidotransferase subunit C [Thermotomaculum hydrothermale]|uniref:Aspartyl/glutamyl-tRNA(Asn/Gln) amidotransferase subunit C n=1 Tax=Thermotomaculum hydrothermale TaxID=981385 RepID=A0A7R6SZI4_9BACT|nr:Asp-tRNA(Asn)/Glu-tRNA(Gln) amidotransferase subunit GatC [Thermotomaculum hydrothermale]BBB32880.1 aspartyl-tRNA(Asn)/glutamyl-tRNA (Gln) amidotransferase subunit C [Thermotomaculum hydrothermale]
MAIDRETVLHIAKLAHIEINEKDVEKFLKQMGEILEYIEQLNEVDIKEVKDSLKSIHEGKVMLREDNPGKSFDRKTVLELAPEVEDIFVKVPPVI